MSEIPLSVITNCQQEIDYYASQVAFFKQELATLRNDEQSAEVITQMMYLERNLKSAQWEHERAQRWLENLLTPE